MRLLRHLCGQMLERQMSERGINPAGTYYHPIPSGDHVIRMVRVEHCPRCNERLDDADMLDRAGAPFHVGGLPAPAVERRAVLAGLARAGYLLGWENGAWFIRRADQAATIASAGTLDAIIEQARAIVMGGGPGGDAPAG